MSKSTLEAVGLAVSGNKDKAAEELAKVGQGLGLNAADQVIAIFKQYESKDYQVETNKKFRGKVYSLGGNYAIITGAITLGVTDRYPHQWVALGASRGLPASLRKTGREVMRQLYPGDSVGMTFAEKHYIKKPDVKQASETGKQGREFYNRLKKVGLLED